MPAVTQADDIYVISGTHHLRTKFGGARWSTQHLFHASSTYNNL